MSFRDHFFHGFDKLLIANVLNVLGYFAALQGDLSLAPYVQEAYALVLELGDRMLVAKTLHSGGYIAMHQGNLTQAATWFSKALSIAQEIQSETDVGMFLSGFALVAIAEEKSLLAAHLFGAIEAKLNVNVDLNPAERAEYQCAVERVRDVRLIEIAGPPIRSLRRAAGDDQCRKEDRERSHQQVHCALSHGSKRP